MNKEEMRMQVNNDNKEQCAALDERVAFEAAMWHWNTDPKGIGLPDKFTLNKDGEYERQDTYWMFETWKKVRATSQSEKRKTLELTRVYTERGLQIERLETALMRTNDLL